MKFSRLLPLAVLLAASTLLTGCGYNRLVGLKQQTDSSWADVENVYQRRADLVPNLVKTVEGSANFEKETLTQVIQARQQVNNIKVDPNSPPATPEAMAAFQQTQDQLSSALSRLLVTVERYPDLKANANFQNLQVEIAGSENRIAVERRKFNESVQQYNTAIKQFPTIIYSGFLGFKERPYFAARAGADQAPDVNFNFNGSPGS
jgi:LemA protein